MKRHFTFLFALLAMAYGTQAQCISATAFGNLSANGSSYDQQEITSCNFPGDYATVTLPAGIWTFSTSVSTDFLTLTNTSNSVISTGTGSVQYSTTSSITVRLHIFLNASCSTNTTCRNSYVQQDSIPVPVISPDDTIVCDGSGPITLTASNLFGSSTMWFSGSCGGTSAGSGSSISVNPATTTTYFAANEFNGEIGSCDSVVVTVASNPSITVSSLQDVLCHGDSTGAITVVAASGTAPYSYAWSTGANTATISQLDTGDYQVVVTDDNGCTGDTTLTITQPDSLSSTITVMAEPLCNGDLTGQASVSVTGGTEPYQYFWSNGDTDSVGDSLAGGMTLVNIIDANGCLRKDSVFLNEPLAITLSISQITDASCHGDSSGAISVVAFGGTGNLTYAWSTGSASNGISGMPAGVYTVTVTDQNGCSELLSDTIGEPEAISTTSGVFDATCHDSGDGMIELTASGGTGSLQFAWSNGANTAAISTLDTGIYHVSITDDNGCLHSESFSVGYLHEDPIIPLDSADSFCTGFSIILDAGNSGTGFLWSTGDTSQTISVGTAASYTVTVTSAEGCSSEQTVMVTERLCTGVDEGAFGNSISLFPNPSNGILYVSSGQPIVEPVSLEVFNTHGARVAQMQLRSDESAINLSGLSAGMYLARISIGEKSTLKRIVIQH